jgi:hypothetical protein
LKIE